MCDSDNCNEAVEDPLDDGLLVCPVSGRTTRRMVTDFEEHCERERGAGGAEDYAAEPEFAVGSAGAAGRGGAASRWRLGAGSGGRQRAH